MILQTQNSKVQRGTKPTQIKIRFSLSKKNDEEEAEELDEEISEYAEEECVFLFKNNDKVESSINKKIVLLSANK